MCARVRFRLDDAEKDAFREACASVGISMSDFLRESARSFVNDPSTVVPDDLQARARSGELSDTNRHRKWAMHQPNNFYEDIQGFLDKRFPPDPEDVRNVYLDEYEERVRLFYDGELEARLVAQLNHVMRTYEVLHPATEATQTDVQAAAVDLGTMLRVDEDMDTVRSFVSDLIDDGVLRERLRDETLDRIREQSKKELQARWKPQWDDATG